MPVDRVIPFSGLSHELSQHPPSSHDANAGPCARLQSTTLPASNPRVPQHEVLGWDGAVEEGNDIAGIARVDLDKLIAVADHAWVRRRRRRDAVCGSCRSRGFGGKRR